MTSSAGRDHAGRAQVARLLDSGRRLLPELQSPPADLAAMACPVLLRFIISGDGAAPQPG